MFVQNALLVGDSGGGPSGTPYRYWRWQLNGLVQAASEVRVTLYEVRYSEDAGSTQYPPNMTSNTAPSGYVASANEEFSSLYAPYKAFNTETTRGWTTTNDGSVDADWLQIDLGSGNEKAFSWLQIKYKGPASVIGTPAGFNVLASNTGAFSGEEVTIHSETGLSAYSDGDVDVYTWEPA